MGNQMTNHHNPQQQEQQKALEQQQSKQKNTAEKTGQPEKKPRWRLGKKSKQQQKQNLSDPVNSHADAAAAAAAAASGNGKRNGGSSGGVCAASRSLALTTDASVEANVASEVAVVVAVDLTPSPDSANRTWSEPDEALAVSQPPPPPQPHPKSVGFGDGGQRDSGISQLSTDEFQRVFEEMSRGIGTNGPCQEASQEEATQTTQLLAPRLRTKRSPTFQNRASTALPDRTEELLAMRQELMSTPLRHRQSAPAVCLVNDDHMFPNAVTPTKVDSGLIDDYDVPYMDDANFFVMDDWYMTDDRRWSYLHRSDTPRLADWDDCRLTESVPNSAKPTPHGTPAKHLFSGRRALFGLCFGAKGNSSSSTRA